MNFLIYRDFSEIFLSFYEFIWNYFELKRIKKIKFYRVLMWQVTWREQKGGCRHVAVYEHTM